MKILLSILFIFQVSLSQVQFCGKSYVVYDRFSKCVIEGQRENESQSVASISKIMTAILAIENNKLDKEVIVDHTIDKAYGSCVYIHIKDKITIQDLLYGLLLRSGNDCGLMLAKATFGSVDKFVEKMNDLAMKLELSNSHFSNPTGLDEEDEGNISCPKDMAILMDYCCQNPMFNKIIKTQVYQRLDGKGSWHNKNRLLKEYSYCLGGKTGFTKKARRTLVTRAKKRGMDLIIVTFNCGNDFAFHKDKYEEVFKKFQSVKIYDEGLNWIDQEVYIFDRDLQLELQPQDQVTCQVIQNQLYLQVNQKTVVCKQLSHYQFKYALYYILKDLIYG